MNIKVVIGANLGDEGKGLVSGALAKYRDPQSRLLTVLFNGGAQRAHTINYDNSDIILHNVGAGNYYGGDTYYHSRFMVDPMALLITQESAIIDPNCRVVLPCDVMKNRGDEENRKHGTCGMGIFACAKRSETENAIFIKDFEDEFSLYNKIRRFDHSTDALYNLDMFMRGVAYIKQHCTIATFNEIRYNYDDIIFEAGQGLLLDQNNKGDFPHLTPSSTGSYNIARMIEDMNCVPELYYVSRTYLTRHGNGPLDHECQKEDINPDIVDKTNQPNDWQGNLRFSKLDTNKLEMRIKNDLLHYTKRVSPRLVFTQLNYTDNKIVTPTGSVDIYKPSFIDEVYVSRDKVDFYKQER